MIFKCKNCGGNAIYDPEKKMIVCPFCDSENNYDRKDKETTYGLEVCPECGGTIPVEQYDSAMVCYREALACTDRMAGGAYSEESVDNARSALYGTIGNLYNMMGDIPTALEYYRMAGEIFDRYGWNESNSILYYNIGETWLEEKDYGQALPAYEKALDYARAADDSLLTANALKGMGAL